MEALVQTHNLTKQYGQHKAVNNVNLSVRKGEIYGLIGRNGAAFTIAAGILTSFKILNIIYALVGRFTKTNLAQYMLDYNIFQVGMKSTESTYIRAAVVGVVFLLAAIMLLYFIMSKKDII